jgi:hypothetical protein
MTDEPTIDDLIRAAVRLDATQDAQLAFGSPPEPAEPAPDDATVGSWGAGAAGAVIEPPATMDEWLRDQFWRNRR